MKNERLLDRIAYCMRAESKSKNILNEDILVRDTFPYNPDSKSAPETARRWAQGYRYDQDAKYVPDVIVQDNEPFEVTITDLDVRSEGGRAYKVIDSEMRRFDLREDQVLEVFRLTGVEPGGKIPGKFVWGILGSSIRLVLVGGELHKMMTEGAAARKAFELAEKAGVHPTPASLRPGHVYRKTDSSLWMFLGRVRCPDAMGTKYAFVPMPKKPELPFDDEDDVELLSLCSDKQKEIFKSDAEARTAWDTMNWQQRFEHDYNNKKLTYGESIHYYISIVFMSTPKFEADVGDTPEEFWRRLRDNSDGFFRYTSTHRWHNLSEEWKLGVGNQRPSPPRDYRLSYDQQRKRDEEWWQEQKRDIDKTRQEYRDALVWLP